MARVVAAAALLAAGVEARIHSLNIKDDPRFAFSIESFGFLDGGKVDLDIHDVQISPADSGEPPIAGFVVYPASTEAAVNEHIDALVSNGICALDVPPPGSLVINISDPSTWKDYKESAEVTGPGMFNLLFTRCSPTGADAAVSFTLEAAFVNPGPNYLSAGDIPLPAIYGVMTVAFAGALGVWVWYIRRHKAERTRIHHLMTALLVVKTLDVMFEAVMYHYISVTGHTTAWNVMFYIFSFIKGILMALVTLLVGAGFGVMKPFLSDREKRILVVALVLQLLTSTAIVVTDELAPGSISFLAWVDVLHIADFIASAAVVVPIVWSMRALQAAQGSGGDNDGKAAETLHRLSMFRNFYMATIAYVYVTRFLLYILSTTLPYNATWFAPFADEAATLAYYVTVGYRFRPHTENAYLRVSGDDDEGDVEMGVATGAAAGTVEGAATAVQTVAAGRRPGAPVVQQTLAAGEGAAAPAPSAPAAGKKAQSHVIEEDDDDFGLDEDDLGEEGEEEDEEQGAGDKKPLTKKAPAPAAGAAPEAAPKMKQVNKARDGR